MKGDHATFTQIAEQWLLHCSKIMQDPFSRDSYHRALKEAEQFLWAGSEMDPVSLSSWDLQSSSIYHMCTSVCYVN